MLGHGVVSRKHTSKPPMQCHWILEMSCKLEQRQLWDCSHPRGAGAGRGVCTHARGQLALFTGPLYPRAQAGHKDKGCPGRKRVVWKFGVKN